MNEIDNILEDMFALDPSLRERDGEIRDIVTRLLALRPSATLDPRFAAELRERIVGVSPHAAPTLSPIQPVHTWWWFLLRAAPLGAIAALLLILVPQTPRSIQDTVTMPYREERGSTTLESSAPASGEMQTFEMSDIDDAANTRSMKQQSFTPEGEGASGSMPADTFSLMAPPPSSSVSVMPQPPTKNAVIESAALEYAGYVAVYTDNNGALGDLLGASDLLSPGFVEQVPVPLMRSMQNNEVLYATIHFDDGDGVFNAVLDPLLYDASGSPLSVLFIASTEMRPE